MKTILFLMADGFEETEFVTPFDYWQRAGFNVVLASISGVTKVTGAHGLKIEVDILLENAELSQYDALFLPGGNPGYKNLLASAPVEKTVLEFFESKRYIFAICAAPLVLSKAGILANLKATCYPGCESDMECREFSEERVVLDKNILTSRGAGTAEEFALECIALLEDVSLRESIREQIVAR